MGGRSRAAGEPPEGGGGWLEQLHLLKSLVVGLLLLDVLSDGYFVSPYGRNAVAACPEVVTDIVALSIKVRPRDVDRALSLDVPNHLRNGVLGRDRDQYVHVVGLRVPERGPS